MTPKPESEKGPNDCPPDTQLDNTSLPPADPMTEEQRNLWEAYREQQRLRSCPGCGDDGGLL
jgi:hypothetical protein